MNEIIYKDRLGCTVKEGDLVKWNYTNKVYFVHELLPMVDDGDHGNITIEIPTNDTHNTYNHSLIETVSSHEITLILTNGKE